MDALAVLFEGALAVLMIVLIAYCVRLNSRLAAIRADDSRINALIERLVEASDRAEASAARLKAAGVAQERALRKAIDEAEQARARLDPRAGTPPASDSPDVPRSAGATSGGRAGPRRGTARDGPEAPAPPGPAGGGTRSDAERALLDAIRQARSAG